MSVLRELIPGQGGYVRLAAGSGRSVARPAPASTELRTSPHRIIGQAPDAGSPAVSRTSPSVHRQSHVWRGRAPTVTRDTQTEGRKRAQPAAAHRLAPGRALCADLPLPLR